MSGRREERRRERGRKITAGLAYLNARRCTWSAAAREAVAKYPALGSIPDTPNVLTCARVLDALPAEDRAEALEELACQTQDVLAALAEKPPMPGRAARLEADGRLARLVASIEKHSTPFALPPAA